MSIALDAHIDGFIASTLAWGDAMNRLLDFDPLSGPREYNERIADVRRAQFCAEDHLGDATEALDEMTR